MKGVVFTEFLEMVEGKFSIDVAEQIIEQSVLSSRAAYTAVGTYGHRELLQMVTQLASVTSIPVPGLVQTFGKHLFARFTVMYPALFVGIDSAFDFLLQVEDYIHVEVRKLYPDAELPQFDVQRTGSQSLEMIYRSSRPFADLAEGLIAGCAEHFGEEICIRREALLDGSSGVRFSLTRQAEIAPCSL